MRLSPVYEKGAFVGMKISGVKTGSIWQYFKFKDNDIVCGGNGVDPVDELIVNSIPDRMKMFQKLQICLIRAGEKAFFIYELKGVPAAALPVPSVPAPAAQQSASSPPATPQADPGTQASVSHPIKLSEMKNSDWINESNAITKTAKETPDKLITCRLEWADDHRPHQAQSNARAGDGIYPCLLYCMQVLEKAGMPYGQSDRLKSAECFSDNHRQGFPH